MARCMFAGEEFAEEKKEGLNMRSEYSEAWSWTTRPKRRRVTRAGVAEELPKKKE